MSAAYAATSGMKTCLDARTTIASPLSANYLLAMRSPPSPETVRSLQAGLLDWFEANRRPLPWREEYRPYHVWISEIMLQQTQMDRVVPYFRRFIELFPDPAALAVAEEDALLKAWEGLGYYSRARNLQKAAKAIVESHGGEIPADHAALLALPGVGGYTAGAVMSFAFNQSFPAVDANVERVFARLFDLDRPVKDKVARAFIDETAQAIIPSGRAREFNQALMELGALVCAPRGPRCGECPVIAQCESRRIGVERERPVPPPAKTVTAVSWAAGLLVVDGEILLRKRPPGVIMGGLWELPGVVAQSGERLEAAARRAFQEDFGLDVEVGGRLAVVRHGFTRFACELSGFLCSLGEGSSRPELATRFAAEARWVAPSDLSSFACNSGQKKLLQKLARDLRLAGLFRG